MTDTLNISFFNCAAAEGPVFSCAAPVVPVGHTFSFVPLFGTDRSVSVFSLPETALFPWHIDEEFLRTAHELFISVAAKVRRVFRCIRRPFRRVQRKIPTSGRMIFARICGLRI